MQIDPGLREELLAMAADDQAARRSTDLHPDDPASVTRALAVDATNLQRLRGIVAEHGWPGSSLVGEDGAGAAWLLAQHADADVAFQRRCLELLEAAVAEGEASRSHLAYLTDRVLVNEGRPQRFGTQFTQVGESFEPRPIEDEERVDERRLDAGLPPLSPYRELRERGPSKGPAESHFRAAVLQEAPEPLPAAVLDAVRGAASALPDVLAVYLVAERRTWSDGRPQDVRTLELVVRDAPEDEPLPPGRVRPIVAEMAAALACGGQVGVSIGIAAPRFVPVVEARGSLLWSRESA
jgi:hypothetical protein